jgi:uncharacterized protein
MFDRLRRWFAAQVPTRESLAANRWLRWIGPSLLHPRVWHLSRRGVALGAAVGAFFAFITPIAQIPLSAAVSVVLRANVPAAVVGTLVNTPPTFGPVYYAAWKVGSWVLGEDTDKTDAPAVLAAGPDVATAAQDTRPWYQRWADTLAAIGKPLLVGTVIFSIAASLLMYAAVSGIWHWRVRRKRRRRLAARAASA